MNTNEEMNTDPKIEDEEVKDGSTPVDGEQVDGEQTDGEVTEEESDAEATDGEEESDEEILVSASHIAELEGKIAEAEAKAAEHLDRLQRSAAEFQNTKRRQEKQLSDSIARAAESVVNGLLPVMDDFDLAFKNLPEGLSVEDDPWVSGFQQIQKKLSQLLDDQGVSIMDFEGDFDPNRHEAISSEASEDVESGQIIETLRAGYEYKDKVIRPALVRVAM